MLVILGDPKRSGKDSKGPRFNTSACQLSFPLLQQHRVNMPLEMIHRNQREIVRKRQRLRIRSLPTRPRAAVFSVMYTS